MNLMKLKGHSSMLGANVMWGLMSPVAKFVMVGGAVTPLVVTDLRITGAMVLFWIASFFQKPERVAPKDLLKLLGASLLAIVFNQGCFIFGVGLTSPVDASIITTSMPLLAMFFWQLPILFIILLLMGMGTTLTGLVVGYKTVTICGTLGALSSIGCLFYPGPNQILIFAPVFIFMMVIPGHVLNHAARKQKKS